MTEQIQIKLSEKELKDILCQRFDLQNNTATIKINSVDGITKCQPDHIEITITADRTKQSDLNTMYYEK